MLRILVFEQGYSVKLRLEGELTEQTAPLLTEKWAEVRSRLGERKGILDLGDVPKIDAAGRSTLAWLIQSGVSISYAHPNLQILIDDLVCNQPSPVHLVPRLWKRLRLGDCSLHWDVRICRVCRLVCSLLPPVLCPCGRSSNEAEK